MDKTDKDAVREVLRELLGRHTKGINDYRAGKIPVPLGFDQAEAKITQLIVDVEERILSKFRICSYCKATVSLNKLGKRRSGLMMYICKDCNRAKNAKYRAKPELKAEEKK